MANTLRGRAFKYSDNVDTDVIIPARYCTAYTAEELGPHCLEDLDPEFVKRVKEGDIIVAGKNFGCGSSRENAPLAIKGAGVSCVIAKSFARIFYRNSINIGLPILESEAAVDSTDSGDELQINLDSGSIENLTKCSSFTSVAFPEAIQKIIRLGGMVNFVKERLKKR
jgi:3-isopropylmalate/(R)-2-methylmalate dehydratase small subunit